jgi:hypothetical protein
MDQTYFSDMEEKNKELLIKLSSYTNCETIEIISFTDEFERFDALLHSGTSPNQICIIAELKIRNYPIKYLQSNGVMLKQKKHKGLFDRRKELGYEKANILYFTFATDGCLIHHLDPNPEAYKWILLPLQSTNQSQTYKYPQLITNLFNPIQIIHY